MNKPVIISDLNKKSLKIKSFLVKYLKNLSSKSNVVIVIGGDGFMLKTLKKNKNSSKVKCNLIIFILVPSARLELALPKGQGF